MDGVHAVDVHLDQAAEKNTGQQVGKKEPQKRELPGPCIADELDAGRSQANQKRHGPE